MISAWSGLGYTSPPSDITLTTSGSPYIWLVSRQLIYVSSDALCVCHQSLMSSSGVIVPCVICIHLPCGPGISQWSSAPPPHCTEIHSFRPNLQLPGSWIWQTGGNTNSCPNCPNWEGRKIHFIHNWCALLYFKSFMEQLSNIPPKYYPVMQLGHEILPIDYHPCDLSWG